MPDADRLEWATPITLGFGILFPIGVFLSLAMSVVAVGPWLTSLTQVMIATGIVTAMGVAQRTSLADPQATSTRRRP